MTPHPLTSDMPEPKAKPRVALVSMPWMAPTLPSIQLASLASALEGQGIESDCYELYLDYAEAIGLNLYKILASLLGFTAEWLFACHYYKAEAGNALEDFRADRPTFGLESRELEDEVLDVLGPVTAQYLEKCLNETDWSKYSLIGFSLTISQLAPSMALARLIKLRHPTVRVVFGGAACAGPMGKAILRVCPYVDAVARVEGELVIGELARRAAAGADFRDVAGVSTRHNGDIVSGPQAGLFRDRASRPPLNYDSYFERLRSTGLHERLQVWLPFEGSRGCWYGEKAQCNFCGLHEIMKFRDWQGEDVLAELDGLYERYGIDRFFAVDLILPKQFFSTLLPELARRDQKWRIFYEVKANLRRTEVKLLANAGIRWIQPGIESLDYDMLRLMRKGVSPTHNIQVLKWCQEDGIRVSWNLLIGLPGTQDHSYETMAERVPLLHHLQPPSGVGQVQLHRFSPYFDNPEEFGIRYLGPHPLYKNVFPVEDSDLRDLVYLHSFDLLGDKASPAAIKRLEDAVSDWTTSHSEGARLDMTLLPGGEAEIVDTRGGGDAILTYLGPEATALYTYLDTAWKTETVPNDFALKHPEIAQGLGGKDGIIDRLNEWDAKRLTLTDRGRTVGLAVLRIGDLADLREDSVSNFQAPLGYLENMSETAGRSLVAIMPNTKE